MDLFLRRGDLTKGRLTHKVPQRISNRELFDVVESKDWPGVSAWVEANGHAERKLYNNISFKDEVGDNPLLYALYYDAPLAAIKSIAEAVLRCLRLQRGTNFFGILTKNKSAAAHYAAMYSSCVDVVKFIVCQCPDALGKRTKIIEGHGGHNPLDKAKLSRSNRPNTEEIIYILQEAVSAPDAFVLKYDEEIDPMGARIRLAGSSAVLNMSFLSRLFFGSSHAFVVRRGHCVAATKAAVAELDHSRRLAAAKKNVDTSGSVNADDVVLTIKVDANADEETSRDKN